MKPMRENARCVLRVAACLFTSCLMAQERDLTSMSLEDFLNIEVTSVSKSSQKLSRTPAAVYVITQDMIRRSGAVNLPEALRLAPGVHVAHLSGSSWAVGIRGFNGVYSNKLLVMIDGRTIYSPLMSGVVWSDQLLMLEDIERIEVIRGPGGTMWGSNAVSGVINIITRSTRETIGGIAALSGGNLDPVRGRVRYGGKLGDAVTWRAWSQYSLQGQTTTPGALFTLDRWTAGRAGMRVDWDLGPQDSLLIEAEAEKNVSQVQFLSNSEQSKSGDSIRNAGGTVAFLMGRWNHKTGRGDEAALQAYYSEDHMAGGVFTATVRTSDLDFHYSYQLTKRHKLLAGGGMRADSIGTLGSPGFYFQPQNRTYYTSNTFLQDEWEIVQNKLTASMGVKVEHFTLAGLTYQPTARLMWTPTAKQGYWVSASQAIRTPAHSDYASLVAVSVGKNFGIETQLVATGSEQFRPEVLKALETGTRWSIGRKWAVDIAAFRHWYQRLQNLELALNKISFTTIPGTATPLIQVPAIVANGLRGINQGGEFAAHFDVRPGLQLTGSYSALFSQTKLRPGVDANMTYSIPSYFPEHQWQIRASWDFRRKWSSEIAFYRIGALAPNALPGYSRLDCRVARKWGEHTEFDISGQNLLRPHQLEFAGSIVYPSGLVARSIEMGVRWDFR